MNRTSQEFLDAVIATRNLTIQSVLDDIDESIKHRLSSLCWLDKDKDPKEYARYNIELSLLNNMRKSFESTLWEKEEEGK